MTIGRSSIGLVLLVSVLRAGRLESATSCAELQTLSLADARVTSTQSVAAGAFVPPAASGGDINLAQQQAFARLPAFCRVVVVSRPSTDSDITIEVWLRAAGWNGRLQARARCPSSCCRESDTAVEGRVRTRSTRWPRLPRGSSTGISRNASSRHIPSAGRSTGRARCVRSDRLPATRDRDRRTMRRTSPASRLR